MRKLFLTAGLLAVCTMAQSAAVISFSETGTGVEGVLSGSLDISGIASVGGFGSVTGIQASGARIGMGPSGSSQVLYDALIGGPTSFGPGGVFLGTGTGDAVFMAGDVGDLYLPGSYVSGGALGATLSIAGATFASLGVNVGTYVYTLTTGDTLTVTFGGTVPAPATLSLAGLALLAAAGLSRRR